MNISVSQTIASAERSMQICNACRYCENLCAVFPAMTEMRTFDQPKLDYLANLCHQCGACFEACQYAPPHPFAVNVRRAFSEQRADGYARFSPSQTLWHWTQTYGAIAGLLGGTLLSLVLLIGAALNSTTSLLATESGNFYAIMPHGLMALLGGASFIFGLGGLVVGALRFWRTGDSPPVRRQHWRSALHDAFSLRYLKDDLCHQHYDRLRGWQRRLHHWMVGGFVLCFAATSLGALYHYLFGWVAPYAWYSLPGLIGSVGGLMMLFGTSGLIGLKMRAPSNDTEATRSMDISLIVMLWMVASTGVLLRVLGETTAIGIILMIHLGFVFAFFLSLPFSKMLHVPLRLLALVRYHAR